MSPNKTTDWLKIGLDILGTEGVRAITIDRMTAALGVTKGSFYHHFKNIQGYKRALLDAWEADTGRIIESIESRGTPNTMLADLLGEFAKRSPLPEIAIRAWAVTDPLPREHMARLDGLRLSFITENLSQALGDGQMGQIAAEIFYSIIIGGLAMHPPLPLTSIATSIEALSSLLGIPLFEKKGDAS